MAQVGRRSDECLMERYADGDSAAFDELFTRYSDRAYAFFLRRTRSEDRASDLFQELFLRLHRSRARYDHTRPFGPWFFQIAQRLLLDDIRRAFRSREVPLGADSSPSCAGEQGRIEAREIALRALGELHPTERRVLVAAKVHGFGYSELAAELGKSVDSVKQLASRALRRLRAGSLGEPLQPGASSIELF